MHINGSVASVALSEPVMATQAPPGITVWGLISLK